MIALLDCNRERFDSAGKELDMEIGQLLSPLTQFADYGTPYGIDNGAYAEFKPHSFEALLDRQSAHKHRCLFVAVPDVVGNARRTLEVFHVLAPRLCLWPVALVMQDGIENLDIPWRDLKAVFIGGTDKFKKSIEALDICKAAKILGKWVHVGRVNHWERKDRFESVGADSIDGTGISLYSHMRTDLSSPRFSWHLDSVRGMEH